jgi:uncharacterized paraquat-inducible protein A
VGLEVLKRPKCGSFLLNMASSMLSKINFIAVDMVELESLHLSDPLASMRLIGVPVTHEICDPVSSCIQSGLDITMEQTFLSKMFIPTFNVKSIIGLLISIVSTSVHACTLYVCEEAITGREKEYGC